MANTFKYALRFVFIALLAAVVLCLLAVYQMVQTMNRALMGAETYTCREFAYDMEQHDTDKYAAMLIATVAYGMNGENAIDKARESEIMDNGIANASAKIYNLCKTSQPSARLFGLIAQTATGAVSGTLVSPTAIVSGTIITSNTNVK